MVSLSSDRQVSDARSSFKMSMETRTSNRKELGKMFKVQSSRPYQHSRNTKTLEKMELLFSLVQLSLATTKTGWLTLLLRTHHSP